jgi:hypothetical protein
MNSHTKNPEGTVKDVADQSTLNVGSPTAETSVPRSQGTAECLEAIEHLLDLSPVDTLKYKWLIQAARVDRMMELEDKLGVIFPGGYREFDKLLKLIEPIFQAELAAAENNKGGSGLEAEPKEAPTAQGHVELTSGEAKAVEQALAFFKKIFGDEFDGEG